MTPAQMKDLQNSDVTIYIGDSTGLPDEVLKDSIHVSLSALPLNHQTELLILTEALESTFCQATV